MTNHSYESPSAFDAATTARHLLEKVSHLAEELTDLQGEVEHLVEATSVQAESDSSRAMPAYLTIKQAQDYLGLSRTTLYRLMRSGALPHHRVGSSVRLIPSEIDDYIQNRKAA